ncbi:MAG: hypothetical protein CMJ75_16445 [Planctomycetaceae bacterium]|nr:hypothetical protein [Planctomycetaceae bacterium]
MLGNRQKVDLISLAHLPGLDDQDSSRRDQLPVQQGTRDLVELEFGRRTRPAGSRRTAGEQLIPR